MRGVKRISRRRTLVPFAVVLEREYGRVAEDVQPGEHAVGGGAGGASGSERAQPRAQPGRLPIRRLFGVRRQPLRQRQGKPTAHIVLQAVSS
jgi:hypothetical protein